MIDFLFHPGSIAVIGASKDTAFASKTGVVNVEKQEGFVSTEPKTWPQKAYEGV